MCNHCLDNNITFTEQFPLLKLTKHKKGRRLLKLVSFCTVYKHKDVFVHTGLTKAV